MEAAVRSDGDVLVVYKDWPVFGAQSERAARVAIASAEQGIYPEVHRRLMTDGRNIDDLLLKEIVRGAGGNWHQLETYLAGHTAAVDELLHDNGVEALSLGIIGTPGYLAGSILVFGAISENDFYATVCESA